MLVFTEIIGNSNCHVVSILPQEDMKGQKSFSHLHHVFEGLRSLGVNKIVLDLNKVIEMDNLAIGQIISWHALCIEQNGKLVIININQRIYNALQIMQLHHVLEIQRECKDLIDAAEFFESSR